MRLRDYLFSLLWRVAHIIIINTLHMFTRHSDSLGDSGQRLPDVAQL